MCPSFASALRRALPISGAILASLIGNVECPEAQRRTTMLVVSVRAADTGQPLSGAQVFLRGAGGGGITNSEGILRVEALSPGAHPVTVRYLGYATQTRVIPLRAGQASELTFVLDVEPIPLAEIRVRPGSHGVRRLANVGFFDRQAHNPGAFVTRADIERRRPSRLSDMLRTVPGVRLAPTPFSDARASMGRSALPRRGCPIQYYVDGTLTYGFNIDDVSPRDVEGLEIYRGASEIPASFNRGTALCGVIVIWTRID